MSTPRDPFPPGMRQKVAKLSMVLTYPDGYVALIDGEDLYATATFQPALGQPAFGLPEVEVQDVVSLAPSIWDVRKLVIEVTLVPNLRAEPALRVKGLFRTEGTDGQ